MNVLLRSISTFFFLVLSSTTCVRHSQTVLLRLPCRMITYNGTATKRLWKAHYQNGKRRQHSKLRPSECYRDRNPNQTETVCSMNDRPKLSTKWVLCVLCVRCVLMGNIWWVGDRGAAALWQPQLRANHFPQPATAAAATAAAAAKAAATARFSKKALQAERMELMWGWMAMVGRLDLAEHWCCCARQGGRGGRGLQCSQQFRQRDCSCLI